MRFLAFALLILAPTFARAEVVRLEVLKREAFAGGKAFGDVGPYERISGVVHYEVDPANTANKAIVDLPLAAKNAAGKVAFQSDFIILAPKDLSKGNGAILYDVNNRGRQLAVRFFNTPAADSLEDEHEPEGNGFLMRRGYTVVWSGWLSELLPGGNRLLMKAPQALENGQPVRGLVRFETSTDTASEWVPISRRPGHGSFPPTKEGEAKATLTQRKLEGDERVAIPREKFKLTRMPIDDVKQGVPGTLPQIRLSIEGGVQPGVLYELIYEAEGSVVQGVGLAGVRDMVSYLRFDQSDKNPIRRADGKETFSRAHAFGVSQSGRFLRHFLYQGFNSDEKNRDVFAGIIPHVAGGGLGFFNHRFASPTRHNGQHEDHLYPCDIFPFTYGPSVDPFTNRTDSILKGNAKVKVMHTQSAAEYWHRAGSLVHTDPLAKQDAVIPDNVRVYLFGGTQHGVSPFPPKKGMAQNLANPGDYRPQLRALLDALDLWVTKGTEPPASVYPRIDGKGAQKVVSVEQYGKNFPAILGVHTPKVVQQPPFAEYGPEFASRGILGTFPPKVHGQYKVLVPNCEADGNDIGLCPPEVLVPLATYTGWNLRAKEYGAEDQLASLLGSYIPLPRTKAEREQAKDGRVSFAERYGSADDYLGAFRSLCNQKVRERYLLQEDADRMIAIRARFVDGYLKAK